MTNRIARFAGATGSAIALAALTIAGTAACGTDDADSGRISVVTSTNVWGDIAATVAGPDAEVTALISDPAADPHSFEVTAVQAAALADADLVVFNGGHYDAFIDKALGGKDKPAVEAVAVAEQTRAAEAMTTGDHPHDDHSDDHGEEPGGHGHGGDHDHGNEHVFYDIHVAGAVAERIAEELGELDPERAAAYAERAAGFVASLGAVEAIVAPVAAERPGQPVLQTEPLASYLVLAAGAEDRTPGEFQEAIEQGTDPAPAAVAAVRELIASGQVRALIYNIQTEDKTTEDVRAAAEAAGIPVVEVTETLPDGLDYIQWQTRNAEALAAALR
ncbi:MAG TPA: zinc ABC transporter substrate-binding protein [Nocardia sp.]|uniref:metal ABC transporter solute-binding protein, Zn/Mn family n=1 Tax=Nocardia TaxID=1817 RepID=UPI002457DAB4|nr:MULTISPECIES: zinc ABC transporter substrate-binding protein [Nocardia]HLS77367.1 zinc ABC transporter substrate-binding protein [Nocardia sp.]